MRFSGWHAVQLFLACIFCLVMQGDDQRFFEARKERDPAAVLALATETQDQQEIPSECYPAEEQDNSGSLWLSYRAENMPNAPTSSVRTSKVKNVFFTSEKCKASWDSLARQTLRRYSLDEREESLFPYKRSRQRPYCGTQPKPVACTYSIPKEGSQVIAIDQGVVPQELELLASAIGSRDVSALYNYPGLNFIVTPTKPASQPQIKVELLKENRKNADGLTMFKHGYVSHLWVLTPKNERQEFVIGDNVKLHFEKILGKNGSWILSREIQGRSEALLSYWTKASSLLNESYDSKQTPELVFGKDRNDAVEGQNVELVQKVTDTVIREAANVLSYSKDKTEMMTAASYWWAARSLQVRVGCNEQLDHPYPNGVQLVEQQYLHQSCRSHYLNWAFWNFNRSIEEKNLLRLDSKGWLYLMLLGSRRERADSFRKALSVLLYQIRNGNVMTQAELSLVANEILQVSEELKRNEVLTWLGFQAMNPDGSDERKLKELKGAFAEFLKESSKYAVLNSSKNIDFYFGLRKIWSWSKDLLALPEWESCHPNDRGDQVLAIESQKEANQFLRDGRRDIKSMTSFYQRSLTLLRYSDFAKAPLCRAWLTLLNDFKKNSAAEASGWFSDLIANDQSNIDCMRAFSKWILPENKGFSSNPADLYGQCKRGHRLSCFTWIETQSYGLDENSFKSLEDLLTTAHFSFQESQEIFEMLDRQIKLAGNRPPWNRLLASVGGKYGEWLSAQLAYAPDRKTINSCLTHEAIEAFVGGSKPIELKQQCPRSEREKLLRWAAGLVVLSKSVAKRKVAQPQEWEENAMTAMSRYRSFLMKFDLPVNKALYKNAEKYLKSITPYAEKTSKDSGSIVNYWIPSFMRFEIDLLEVCLRNSPKATPFNKKIHCQTQPLEGLARDYR